MNDLWQAIELGALAPRLPEGSRRAVVFVSMQWFMCSGTRSPASRASSRGPPTPSWRTPRFPTASSAAWRSAQRSTGRTSRAVRTPARWPARHPPSTAPRASASTTCASPGGSARTGARSQGGGAAADGSGPGPDDLPETASGEPDWEGIVAAARERAVEASSSNDLGLYDAWYEKEVRRLAFRCPERLENRRGRVFQRAGARGLRADARGVPGDGRRAARGDPARRGTVYDQTAYTRDVRARFTTWCARRARGRACARRISRIASMTRSSCATIRIRRTTEPRSTPRRCTGSGGSRVRHGRRAGCGSYGWARGVVGPVRTDAEVRWRPAPLPSATGYIDFFA